MTPRYQPVGEGPQVPTHRPDLRPADPAPDPVPDRAPAPPPRARRRAGREQFNTQILPTLRQLLDAFVRDHDSTVQGVVEEALREYMAARGVDVSSTEEPR